MSSAEAGARRTGMRRKAMVTVIAAVQVAWVLAILYGVVWLLT